ncbi:AlbA family DNA-binding domain-containing protein [Lutibacter sp.]
MEKNFDLFLQQIISRSKSKEQIEEDKLELKSEWYKFDSSTNKNIVISEFLKDIVSIANTPGLDGYLIIGINEKNGDIKNSPFSESGLKDITYLKNIIVKNVDRPIDFEYKDYRILYENQEYIIGLFIIPPSLDKPHVIRHYVSKNGYERENYIPIRKTTRVFPATRSDIDFMYYDRKNIEPEYALELKTYNPKIDFNSFSSGSSLTAKLQVCFLNFGRKPIAIVNSELLINKIEQNKNTISLPLVFNLIRYEDTVISKRPTNIRERYIVVPSNNIVTLYLHYRLEKNLKQYEAQEINSLLRTSLKFSFNITAKDIDNRDYFSEDFTCIYKSP